MNFIAKVLRLPSGDELPLLKKGLLVRLIFVAILLIALISEHRSVLYYILALPWIYIILMFGVIEGRFANQNNSRD